MELSLTCPFPLSQFLEPRHICPCVFGTARNSIADELQNELHPFQRRVEAHQEERIELRLECARLDDLVVALPIVDLGLRERMEHHQVKCPLIGSYWSVIARMLDRNEAFVERNVEFSRKDLLRIKCVVVPELLQNFSCLGPRPLSSRHRIIRGLKYVLF
jgi:hypothetical protein